MAEKMMRVAVSQRRDLYRYGFRPPLWEVGNQPRVRVSHQMPLGLERMAPYCVGISAIDRATCWKFIARREFTLSENIRRRFPNLSKCPIRGIFSRNRPTARGVVMNVARRQLSSSPSPWVRRGIKQSSLLSTSGGVFLPITWISYLRDPAYGALLGTEYAQCRIEEGVIISRDYKIWTNAHSPNRPADMDGEPQSRRRWAHGPPFARSCAGA